MDELKDTYSISDAASHSGLSPRQIRYLEDLGHIKPDYIKIGSICQRRYPVELMEQLIKIAKLRQEGFELGAAVVRANEE